MYFFLSLVLIKSGKRGECKTLIRNLRNLEIGRECRGSNNVRIFNIHINRYGDFCVFPWASNPPKDVMSIKLHNFSFIDIAIKKLRNSWRLLSSFRPLLTGSMKPICQRILHFPEMHQQSADRPACYFDLFQNVTHSEFLKLTFCYSPADIVTHPRYSLNFEQFAEN